MDQISKICKGTHQGKREPVARRFSDTDLLLHIVRQVRKSVALLQTTLRRDLFVTAGERNWLKRQKRDLLRVIQCEANNRADLVVVDSVYESCHQHNLNTSFVQVVDGAHLHIKQVTDLAMTVCIVTDAVKLKIYIAQSRFSCFAAEFFALRELNTVGRSLDAVVSHFPRISDRLEEVRRNRRLTTRKLNRHLPAGFNRDCVIQNLFDLVHA